MGSARPKPPCPVCGDPNAFPLWIDDSPPGGCAVDEAWHTGLPKTIRNVTECPLQMGRARQSAEFRRLVPDAFDETGTMLRGQLARVLNAYANEHPGRSIIL